MKGNRLKWFGSLLIFVFLNMSCAGTKIAQEYTDDDFTGNVSNILVIALTGSPLHQERFEKSFVEQLKSIGIDAVSSREVMTMPSDLTLTKEMIKKAIQQNGNDAVIISQFAAVEEDNSYRLGSVNYGYYDYYHMGHSYLLGTGSKSSNTTTVLLETKLFDVKTEKMIWSATSKTLERDPEEGEILISAVETLVDELQHSQLISPR